MDERDTAIAKAINELNKRAASSTEYIRGHNDCLAFLFVYDEYLRGYSKARDYIDFEWKTTRGFFIQLLKSRKTLEDFANYCNYNVLRNEKPILGDIAFSDRAMIFDGDNWLSTNEDNSGVDTVTDVANRFVIHARPIRS